MDKSVTTRVWISREKRPKLVTQYEMWTDEPSPMQYDNGDVIFSYNSNFIQGFCAPRFHRMTPIRLKPGTCKQFDLTISAIEVKE